MLVNEKSTKHFERIWKIHQTGTITRIVYIDFYQPRICCWFGFNAIPFYNSHNHPLKIAFVAFSFFRHNQKLFFNRFPKVIKIRLTFNDWFFWAKEEPYYSGFRVCRRLCKLFRQLEIAVTCFIKIKSI